MILIADMGQDYKSSSNRIAAQAEYDLQPLINTVISMICDILHGFNVVA